jgi:N-acetylneuraminate lyase
MSKPIVGGIWPAILTCLDENRRPCEANITKMIELFVQQKVGGLYVLGSTGQGPALDMATRKKTMELVSKANKGRLPLMLHVGAVSPFEAVELAKHGADHGADAISSVAPIYFPPTADMLFAHYSTIASATKLPFYAYHFNATNLPPLKEYVSRMLEVPNIAGMKITDTNLIVVEMVIAYAKGKLQIFSGCDEINLPAVISGADGAIGSFYNMFAPACIKAREALLKGDIAAAKKFMVTFCRVIMEIVGNYNNTYPFFRQSMQMMYGIDIGTGANASSLVYKPLPESQVRAWIDEVNQAAGL